MYNLLIQYIDHPLAKNHDLFNTQTTFVISVKQAFAFKLKNKESTCYFYE